jgi:membrane-associated protease RseP (regulator of RpoE activity)
LDPSHELSPSLPPAFVWERPRKFQDRVWLHWLLFLVTLGTTTLVGTAHYLAWQADYTDLARPSSSALVLLAHGLWYSLTVLAILGCHELGHYFACRYYDVDASRPYFIPAPFILTGTFGAVIRIREPIPAKHMLFDIGIAGPIAGFLVAVPALFIGIALSHVARVPPDFVGIELGEPLLFRAAEWLIWGVPPDGYSLNLHPMAFAAWFGLLATALNLFPIAQLDGGHISYAVLGRRSTAVTFIFLGVALVLTYFSLSWLVWTLLLVVMIFLVGPRHPRVFDEEQPLDRTRLWLALFALVMFVLCFTPAPIQPTELLR